MFRKSGIHIKPSHEGRLHENLGVKQGDRIPVSKLEAAKHSDDPAVRRRATFALNARKWHHGGKRRPAPLAHPKKK